MRRSNIFQRNSWWWDTVHVESEEDGDLVWNCGPWEIVMRYYRSGCRWPNPGSWEIVTQLPVQVKINVLALLHCSFIYLIHRKNFGIKKSLSIRTPVSWWLNRVDRDPVTSSVAAVFSSLLMVPLSPFPVIPCFFLKKTFFTTIFLLDRLIPSLFDYVVHQKSIWSAHCKHCSLKSADFFNGM